MTTEQKVSESIRESMGDHKVWFAWYANHLARKIMREFNVTERVRTTPVTGFNPDDTTRG